MNDNTKLHISQSEFDSGIIKWARILSPQKYFCLKIQQYMPALLQIKHIYLCVCPGIMKGTEANNETWLSERRYWCQFCFLQDDMHEPVFVTMEWNTLNAAIYGMINRGFVELLYINFNILKNIPTHLGWKKGFGR